MLTNINFLQSKPEFEVFSYANRAFDKQKKLSSDSKIKERSKAILSTLSIFSSTAADLMTVSFRFASHLKTLDDYNQSFNLRRPFSKLFKHYKKLDYKLAKLVKLDVREIEYKRYPLTSRLIVELEKISKISKIKKIIIKALIVVAVQFTAIIDTLTLPIRHYTHLKITSKINERSLRRNRITEISMLFFIFYIIKDSADYINHLNRRMDSYYNNNFLLSSALLLAGLSCVSLFTEHKSIVKSLRQEVARLQQIEGNWLQTAENNILLSFRNLRLERLLQGVQDQEEGALSLLNENRSLIARIEQMEKDKPEVKPVEYGKIPPSYLVMSNEEGSKKCSICLDDVDIAESVTHLKTSAGLHGAPCSIFCRKCIDPWLKNNCSCPVCKETITKNSLKSVEVFPSIPSHYGVKV